MSKYWNKKVDYNSMKFDSIVEKDYYIYLSNNSDIELFTMQPKYLLQPSFKNYYGKIQDIEYKADFYVKYKDWTEYVIDIKWMATPNAKLKRKMFMYKYPEKILQWLVRYKWERVDYFNNEKRKRDNKILKSILTTTEDASAPT